MNTLMILRQHELEELGLYQQKVNRFLESSHRRERWLGIYRRGQHNTRKLGYSGTTIEKTLGADGTEYHTTIESKIHVDIFGKGAWLLQRILGRGFIEINGQMIQDVDLKPMNLSIEVNLPQGTQFHVQGREDGDSFIVTVHNEAVGLPSLKIPRDKLELGNGLFPSFPLAGLEEGEAFQIPTFDPVFQRQEMATVEVVSLETQEIDGVLVDLYTLETTFRGTKSKSLVTRDGTLLRTELGPPLDGTILRREKEKNARRGVRDD